MDDMIDPTITCPKCKTEIKLTESLAAPLIESTRRQFETRFAAKEAEVAGREAEIRDHEAAIAAAQQAIDEQVAQKLKTARGAIAAEEAKKARQLLSGDLETRAKEITNLQEVLKERDQKLAQAQNAQAELIRKQREFDDAKREMELTIEKRIQKSLASTREQAKKEAEDELNLKVGEREQTIAAMHKQVEELKDKAREGSQVMQTTRKECQTQIAAKEAEVAVREAEIEDQQAQTARALESIDEQVAQKLKTERGAIAAEEAKKARQLLSGDLETRAKEITNLQEVLKERDQKLAQAQNAQAELIRKQRELDDAKREMELTIEKRIQEEVAATRTKARQEGEDGMKLKVAEREHIITAMQKQIEELKRKAEQGSQQLQGEVQELELENVLRGKFPGDTVEAVAKGVHGGDVLHHVIGPLSQCCGTILWECKRTKNWSDGWLGKLRDDQRTVKAEMAVIVSQVLPRDVANFDLIGGVWVTTPSLVIPVAMALRHLIVELAAARQAGEGQQTKMEMVYQYMTGPRFRQRVMAIVEKFSSMQEDLAKERKMMTRLWAKREGQIRCVIDATAGMYGDLQGIAGKTLQEIEGLDVLMLESSSDNTTQAGTAQIAGSRA
jgi:hypothetical protein